MLFGNSRDAFEVLQNRINQLFFMNTETLCSSCYETEFSTKKM